MRGIRRYNFGDFIERALDDMAIGFDYLEPRVTNFTFNGRWVDEDKYDIVPKPSYYETLITRKQEQIDACEREFETYKRHYEERLQKLREDKEKLLRERDNKNKDA